LSQILTLRPVRADDEPFLSRLFYLAQLETLKHANLNDSERDQLIALVYTGFKRHYSMVVAALDDRLVFLDQEPIGRMIIIQSDSEIRLADLLILSQYRNRGIGSALISQLQTESIISKRPLRLCVVKHSPSVRLYRRLGFYLLEDTGVQWSLEWTASGRDR
jgi:ribosomal protein S18 acetylase RimI-like enzyme